jgi:FkbM family methyltransferase
MSVFRDVKSGYLFCIEEGNDCADRMIENGIHEYGLIEWCQQYLSPEGVFVDAGAHIGTYSIILSSYCKKVYSFEAQKSTFDCLCRGIQANNITNIETYNIGLGSTNEVLTLNHISEDGGGSSFLENIAEISGNKIIHREVVTVKPLDDFDISNIELIKMDVEGFELELVKGSLKTLDRSNYPPIFFDAWSGDKYKTQRESLIEYLECLGYRVFPVRGSNGTMYLASDHQKYVDPRDRRVQKQSMISLKHEILAGRMSSLNLTENEWVEVCHSLYVDRQYHKLYDCCVFLAKTVSIPKTRTLILRYLASSSYFIGDLDKSRKLYEDLLVSYHTPFNVYNDLILEYSKLMDRLPLKSRTHINFLIEEGFHPSSTSIIKKCETYLMCMRTVNYILFDDGGYRIYHQDGCIKTINHLATLDDDLNIRSFGRLIDVSKTKKYPVNIRGMEDIRLFGDNYMLAVYPQINSLRIPQVCFGEYSQDGIVNKILPLSLTENIQCEKNWLPFMVNDEIQVIYSFDPLTIYKVDKDTGTMELVKSKRFNQIKLKEFRGSAPPIPYKNGYLLTIHQVSYTMPRKYFHRFVWMDQYFDSIKYSDLFYFQSVEIEYNLSICHHKDGLLIPYSYRDSSSVIGILEYDVLDSMLNLS